MIRYKFNKVSREQLTKIAVNAINALADKRNFETFVLTLNINALADKRNFETFVLTLNIDGDESSIEVIKE